MHPQTGLEYNRHKNQETHRRSQLHLCHCCRRHGTGYKQAHRLRSGTAPESTRRNRRGPRRSDNALPGSLRSRAAQVMPGTSPQDTPCTWLVQRHSETAQRCSSRILSVPPRPGTCRPRSFCTQRQISAHQIRRTVPPDKVSPYMRLGLPRLGAYPQGSSCSSPEWARSGTARGRIQCTQTGPRACPQRIERCN